MASNHDNLWQHIKVVNEKAKNLLEPFDAGRYVEHWDTIEHLLTNMIRMLRNYLPAANYHQRPQIAEWMEYASEFLLRRNQIFNQFVRDLICNTTGPIYYRNLPSVIQQQFEQKARLIIINWVSDNGTHNELEQTFRSIEDLKRENLRPYLAELYGIIEAYNFTKEQRC